MKNNLVIEQLRQLVVDYLSLQPQQLFDWAGQLLSEGKERFQADRLIDTPTLPAFINDWQAHTVLYRNTAVKFLFIMADHVCVCKNPTNYSDRKENISNN